MSEVRRGKSYRIAVVLAVFYVLVAAVVLTVIAVALFSPEEEMHSPGYDVNICGEVQLVEGRGYDTCYVISCNGTTAISCTR